METTLGCFSSPPNLPALAGSGSVACDSGVVSAVYAAEKMGLSFQCSYNAACVLQDKRNFRQFLIDNGFNCPKAKKYEDRNVMAIGVRTSYMHNLGRVEY